MGKDERTAEWNPLVRLGGRIRELRVARGWNQAQLAARSQLHENQIWLVETGRRNPSAKTLLLICAALRVHPSEVWKDFTMSDLRRLSEIERRVRSKKDPD